MDSTAHHTIVPATTRSASMGMSGHCEACDQALFDSVDLEQTRGSGTRGEDCTVCLDPVRADQESLVHSKCNHAWHESCLQSWITAKIGPSRDDRNVHCPICREVIAYWVNRQQIGLKIHTKQTTHEVIDRLRSGSKVHFIPRSQIRFPEDLEAPDLRQFVQEHFFPDAQGQVRKRAVPFTPIPGSELFRGVLFTQGACIRVQDCDHDILVILLPAEQVYASLCALYALGWNPYSGVIENRVKLDLLRGKSLSEVLVAAEASGVRDISHAELKRLFPDFQPFRIGLELHLRLRLEKDGQGRSYVDALVYEPLHLTMTVLSSSLMTALVRELGPLGDNFVLNEIQDQAYVGEFRQAFLDIHEPFAFVVPGPGTTDA